MSPLGGRSGHPETKKRKDMMMTESYEEWESGIDWSKRTSVVGGPVFYEFVKAKALPALEDGIRQLEAAKADCEERIRKWGSLAERAGRLAECFAELAGDEFFMRMAGDFDRETAEIFAGESIPTLSGWLRIGARFTAAMRDGTSIPAKYAKELAEMNGDIASVANVRSILQSFISACDNDYRLRCAPERFRTRVFRDLARDFSEIVLSGSKVDFERIPSFLRGVAESLKMIIEVSESMQGVCRRAKKAMKRHGSAFWSKLDGWNAMRRAV